MLDQVKILKFWMLIVLPITSRLATARTTAATTRLLIPGNITIGGLMSVHLPTKTGECSRSKSIIVMEVLEALLFSVDRVNANKSILPNITLGVRAFDTCGSATAALDRAVKHFVMGDSRNSHGESCAEFTRPVFGIIGPGSSYESAHITPVLNLFEIPMISYAATSPELSDKSKFEYFSRTIPSDASQTKAIIDLLIYFNWTYVSVLYTDESYGINGYTAIKEEAEKKGICIGNEKKKVPLVYNKNTYDRIIKEILSKDAPAVVVLFCVRRSLIPLISEIHEQFAGNKILQLVGSETLMNAVDEDVLLKTAKNIFIVYLPTLPVEDFQEYFLNLTTEKNTRNPWFKEFFQEKMNCAFENNQNDQVTKICSPNSTLRNANISSYLSGRFSMMPLVMDGVYAFAHALSNILEERCGYRTSNSCIPVNDIPGKEILETIRTQTFVSPFGYTVNFTSSGDVTGAYDIFYVGEVNSKVYTRLKIGQWRGHGLEIPPSQWKEDFDPITSDCSKPCGKNQIRRGIRDKPDCCWQCEDCPLQALAMNQTTCVNCAQGSLPNNELSSCVKIKEKYLSLDGRSVSIYLPLLLIIVSSIAIVFLCFVAFVFVRFHNTPLVKASGRELSALLLIGLFASFLLPFIAISKPSPFTCFLKFILNSLPMTVCYVAIIVKNNRIFRILNPERNLTTKPSFVRPKSQIAISLGLISFQLFLLLALMLLEPPRDQFLYPSPTEVYHICQWSRAQGLLSHAYNIILLIACTYYAYKTRNIPRNFNEAKYIAFAMYGLCVTFVAFTVISFTTKQGLNDIEKSAIGCFNAMLTAIILLVCFFVPKIYIILWKSEENINHGMVNEDSSAYTQQDRSEITHTRHVRKSKNTVGIADEEEKQTVNTVSRSTQTGSDT